MNSLENIQELFFSIFTIVSIVGSFGVIFLPNLVYAGFFSDGYISRNCRFLFTFKR